MPGETLRVPTFPGSAYGHRRTSSSPGPQFTPSSSSHLYSTHVRSSLRADLTSGAAHLRGHSETLRVLAENAPSHRRMSSCPGPGPSSIPSSSSNPYSTHSRSSSHTDLTAVAARANRSCTSRVDIQGATLRLPTQNLPSHRRTSSSPRVSCTSISLDCEIAQWHRANHLIAHTELPLLTYDISLHPCTLTTLHPQGAARLLEPAVYPPQRALSLVIQSPDLPWPWPIDVFATKARYVSVGDVLHSLYRAGRVGVTRAELDAVHSPDIMDRITQAYERRYSRLEGLRGFEEEKGKGVKRVDFLLGCTKSRGLVPAPSVEEGMWVVFVS